jgi:hypothetical protein
MEDLDNGLVAFKTIEELTKYNLTLTPQVWEKYFK